MASSDDKNCVFFVIKIFLHVGKLKVGLARNESQPCQLYIAPALQYTKLHQPNSESRSQRDVTNGINSSQIKSPHLHIFSVNWLHIFHVYDYKLV